MAAQPRTRLLTNISNKGFEQVTILVHGYKNIHFCQILTFNFQFLFLSAINVPNIDDRQPCVYVTG